MVKVYGSTVKVPLILVVLSTVEVGGIYGVAVKCIDTIRTPIAKAAYYTETDAEARKRGERTGLDTLVVHAVNDEDSLLAIHSSGQAKALSLPPGEYDRKIETQRN